MTGKAIPSNPLETMTERPVIWQTTNMQPWVEALLSGRTTVKTRSGRPAVPVGAVVLLHASKTKTFKRFDMFPWIGNIDFDALKASMGCVCGIGVVKTIGHSLAIMTAKERKLFTSSDGEFCGATYGIKYHSLVRLKVPVPTVGFQAPFARAKPETIEAVIKFNPAAARCRTTSTGSMSRSWCDAGTAPVRTSAHASGVPV
jgi:hypothetical protein